MNENVTQKILEDLNSMFSHEWLQKIADETGLIKRERIINPTIMFWTLVLGFGVRLQRSLASLKRLYENRSGRSICDSSWYDRFTPELVEFLHQCVIHGIRELAKNSQVKLGKKLQNFEDILIQDSTIIRLHKFLADKFPAARSRIVAAGIKVSVLVSAVANGPKSVALFGERVSEIKTLKIGSWVKDRILLIDLGFYKHHTFTRIVEYGGYFVSRWKKVADPTIISVTGGLSKDLQDKIVGKKLSEIIPILPKNGILDAIVEVTFKRRIYKGQQRQDTQSFRLVGVYNDESEKYHIYLTNIQADILGPEDIARLYGARWDIELLFKELKNKYAFDVIKTKNEQIIEALIWTGILTLLVSRRLHCFLRELKPDKPIIRFTQLRWSIVFAENASDLLTEILKFNGITRTFELMLAVSSSQALDPHVNRKRFRSEWWA
ncbi:MAG: IS4 family transposase [Methanoregula sp.]|nr:IS4 family transposase [Methanoregula sp.]